MCLEYQAVGLRAVATLERMAWRYYVGLEAPGASEVLATALVGV